MSSIAFANFRSIWHQISKFWKNSIALLLGLSLSLVLAIPTQAHWADLAVADVRINERDVELNLTIPTGILARFDDDRDQRLSSEEVGKYQTELKQFFDRKLKFTVAGQQQESVTIAATAARQQLPSNLTATPNTHSNLLLKYRWSQSIASLQLDYDLFVPGVNTARCLTQVSTIDRTDNFVLTPTNKNVALIDPPLLQQITSFIGLGIEHIFTGYDHILFLISLLMLGGGLKYLIKIVTAFSISHSITLFLAVLRIVSLPSRWVEIAIALSIAYIAAENFWRTEPNKSRWQLSFGFGLIHGLGFSSALQELELPQNNLVVSLLSFSAGIEIGQISIVLIAFLGLSYLRKFPWDLAIRRLISAGAIVMSAIWFWERAFLG